MASPFGMKEAFAAISAIPLDVLKKVVGEIIVEFLPLQPQLASEDPKVREEAVKKTEELKVRIKDQLMKTYKEAGVDIDAVIASFQNEMKRRK